MFSWNELFLTRINYTTLSHLMFSVCLGFNLVIIMIPAFLFQLEVPRFR
jgi:hypothetical protein